MISRIYRCAFALVFVFAASVFAQETRGTISGHVLDEQGGAMPGVTVTITNVDTNVSATLSTNSTGYYQARLRLTALLFGRYRLPPDRVESRLPHPHRPRRRHTKLIVTAHQMTARGSGLLPL